MVPTHVTAGFCGHILVGFFDEHREGCFHRSEVLDDPSEERVRFNLHRNRRVRLVY